MLFFSLYYIIYENFIYTFKNVYLCLLFKIFFVDKLLIFKRELIFFIDVPPVISFLTNFGG